MNDPELILEPTETAEWYTLIKQAEDELNCSLNESIESYLVFLLMRTCTRPDITSNAAALTYLKSAHTFGASKKIGLQETGDLCLIIAGMFPEVAQKRLVKINYFIDLGKSAYGILSEHLKNGYGEDFLELSRSFTTLVDLLHRLKKQDIWLLDIGDLLEAGSATAQAALPQRTIIIPETFKKH